MSRLPGTDTPLPVRGIRLGAAAAAIKRQDRDDLLVIEAVPGATCAGVFTRNAFCAAPVVIARQHLAVSPRWLLINSGNANAGTGDQGLADALATCRMLADLAGGSAEAILPFSTGVIGEFLPVDKIAAALPLALAALDEAGWERAARAIMTTDTRPKIASRTCQIDGETITVTGIAKGAGMIEPNLATMLVYLLTDIAVPRAELRQMLARAVDASFNAISIDSDTSTSDTVVALSSGRVPFTDWGAFERALHQVCRDLAEDVVRNGEGVRHVIRVTVRDAASLALARALGKAVVNGPLFKCAVAGNDPNVGRLIQAIGKHVGAHAPGTDLSGLRASLGGIEIFSGGVFRLNPEKEAALVAHLRGAELYASRPGADGVFSAPIDFPPHERAVELEIALGNGAASATVLGGDLTHEYVSENADYRS